MKYIHKSLIMDNRGSTILIGNKTKTYKFQADIHVHTD